MYNTVAGQSAKMEKNKVSVAAKIYLLSSTQVKNEGKGFLYKTKLTSLATEL